MLGCQVWAVTDPPPLEGVWLYCITENGHELSGPCKVGIARYINKRFSSLQGGNWRQLACVWLVHFTVKSDALQVEGLCLLRFRPSDYGSDDRKRLESEWIDARPCDAMGLALQVANSEADYQRVTSKVMC